MVTPQTGVVAELRVTIGVLDHQRVVRGAAASVVRVDDPGPVDVEHVEQVHLELRLVLMFGCIDVLVVLESDGLPDPQVPRRGQRGWVPLVVRGLLVEGVRVK